MIEGYTPVTIFPWGNSSEAQVEQSLNVGFFQDRYEHYNSMNPTKLVREYKNRCEELIEELKSKSPEFRSAARLPDANNTPKIKQDLIVKIITLDRRLGRIDSAEFNDGRGIRNFAGDTQ